MISLRLLEKFSNSTLVVYIQDFKMLVLEGKFTTEVKEFPPLPSLFPSLETAYLIAVAGDIRWLIPALSGLHEMSSLKTLVFKNEEGNGMFFSLIKKFPSLFIVAIKGSEFLILLMSFVLPKFNSFATLELANCPLTSADLSTLFSGLYKTNTLRALKLTSTKLGTQGAKQLAAAL